MTNIEVMHKLSELDLEKCSDYQIQDLLATLIERGIPAIRIILEPNVFVVRMREGNNYYNIHDLSYKPASICTAYQRATCPGETAFYGTIADNFWQLDKARLLASCECSSLCRMGGNSKGVEIFTCSQWKILRPLKMIVFFSDNIFAEYPNNFILSQCKVDFENMIDRWNTREEGLMISRFFSNEFCKIVKNPYEYKISANLVRLLRLVQKTDIDGIIYPSGIACGMFGLNVAIFPEAADWALSFKKKAKQVLYKNKDIIIPRIEGYAEDIGAEYCETQHFSDEDLSKRLQVQFLNML